MSKLQLRNLKLQNQWEGYEGTKTLVWPRWLWFGDQPATAPCVQLPEVFKRLSEGQAPEKFTRQHLKDLGFTSLVVGL